MNIDHLQKSLSTVVSVAVEVIVDILSERIESEIFTLKSLLRLNNPGIPEMKGILNEKR